ncbi:hypothetical protein V8G61_12370 [Gaetbulibacter sp. M240]|uniref:hypothetical protein n=1 Tax=Gaetbulibacter sp. M240 TaxID=3126511 RepID=UPI00374F825B
MKCEKCHQTISFKDIDIENNHVKCKACGHESEVSQFFADFASKFQDNLGFNPKQVDPNFDIHKPPKGAWIHRKFNDTIIGATTRSLKGVIVILAAVLFTRIVYNLVYIDIIQKNDYNTETVIIGLIFVVLLGFLYNLSLMGLFGKVEITTDHDGGNIFTGIGPIGTVKTFKWQDVSSITEKSPKHMRPSTFYNTHIQIYGQKKITFGSQLTEAKKHYIINAMKVLHLKYGGG